MKPVCVDAMKDEKNKHVNKLKVAKTEFAHLKDILKEVFDDKQEKAESKRLEKHMNKIRIVRENIQNRKLPENSVNTDVTLVRDDEQNSSHNVTLASDDEMQI